MQSTKPYLIRAIHEWCVDQGYTPYLSVSVDKTTRVPPEFIVDACIVLNVGFDATNQLNLANDEISFQARFSGRVFPVLVPVDRVLAIYARENGQGMAFDVAVGDAGSSETAYEKSTPVSGKPKVSAGLSIATTSSPSGVDPDDNPPASGSRPQLKRIK